jgi:hypothetical protein
VSILATGVSEIPTFYTIPPAFLKTHSPINNTKNTNNSACEFQSGTGGRVS